MRKLIKRIAVCACAVALAAAGIFAGKATTVKAAEYKKTTMHILVKGAPEGTNQIAINAWNGAWVDVEGQDNWPDLSKVTTALTSWGWGSTPAGKIDMTKDANGMYTCTMVYDAGQDKDSHGMQIFMYGPENAAVAASAEAFKLLADESVTEFYAIVDYTNAVKSEGGVVTFQTKNPLESEAPSEKPSEAPSEAPSKAPSEAPSKAPSETDANAEPTKPVGTSDSMAVTLVVLVAVAAVAAATVVITRKKSVEE